MCNIKRKRGASERARDCHCVGERVALRRMNVERASAWVALALLVLVSRVDSMVLDRGATVLSPLEVRVLEAPRPVRGADDRIHRVCAART